MTPYQYQYPYFLDLTRLNLDLAPYHLQSGIKGINEENPFLTFSSIDINLEGSLFGSLIELGHDHFFMISDPWLYTWYKQHGGLVIRQFNLRTSNPSSDKLEEFVDIHHLTTGIHAFPTQLHYNRFITFIRKENLPRKEEWHEIYVIVVLHKQTIRIIPFDSFNETGGDPLYQWPALAVWDWEKGKLHGLGMRMGSFTVDFRAP